MKLRLFTALFLCFSLMHYDLQGQINVPVKFKEGFGPFAPQWVAYGDVHVKNGTAGESNLQGIPATLRETKMGVWVGVNQSDAGKPLAFLYSKTSEGQFKIWFDKNRNGDFADEAVYPLSEISEGGDAGELAKDTVQLPIQVAQSGEEVKRLIPFVFGVNRGRELFYAVAMHGKAKMYSVDLVINLSISDSETELITQLIIQEEGVTEDSPEVEAGQLFRVKKNIFRYAGTDLLKESLRLDRIPLRRALQHQRVPDFSTEDISTGEIVSLQDYKGKFLYIDFWGSWCKPCIEEMPYLRRAVSELKLENIEFLGIMQDSRKAAKKAIERYNVTWPQLLSVKKNSLTEAFEVDSFPTTLLLGPNGKVIAENLRGESLMELLLEEMQIYKLKSEMN